MTAIGDHSYLSHCPYIATILSNLTSCHRRHPQSWSRPSRKFNPMTHTFKVFRHRLPVMSLLPYHHFDCPYHQCIPTNSPRVCCRLLPQAQSHVNPAVYLAGLAATDFTISPWLDLTADSTISPCRYSQTSSTLSPASSAHFRRLTWRLTVLTSGGFVLTDSDRTM